mmetsp:Transcript_11224/g.29878  ORF Transcript_11224/g.29878 Transcript_11224/m.29878 type:complete len:184 (-) Transcript_11224:357-908(-)
MAFSMLTVEVEQEPSRGRGGARGGGCERYASPESAYFDPPAWTSLADANILGLPASPTLTATTQLSLPLERRKERAIEEDLALSTSTEEPRSPLSMTASYASLVALGLGGGRKWSDMSEEAWDASSRDRLDSDISNLRASGMEKVDSDGCAIPRRWMRGKRGGTKHRSKASYEGKAKAGEEEL